MIDASSLQAIAAVGGFMLALISLIGGWTWWLIRDLERNLRREMESIRQEMERNRQEMERSQQEMERNLRQEMERNHRELLTHLAGHTHGEDGSPVFHLLPDPGD